MGKGAALNPNEKTLSTQCRVDGGKIWYRICNEHSDGVPVIVVHGGPGTPHNYLESLSELLPNNPVIFYDQLDCGLSEKTDNHELWYLERFVDEIEKLREHLDYKHFHLYGHSAGTMFAFDYALEYPERVLSLVLASPVLSNKRYQMTMMKLLSKFPEPIGNSFISALENNETSSIGFMEGMAFFAEHYLCRLPIWPDALFEASIQTNITLKNFLWGNNSFIVDGVLKDYERLDELSYHQVKTLITCGEHDFIIPEDCKLYAELMPNVELAIIPDASHHVHLEQPVLYSQILQSFIK